MIWQERDLRQANQVDMKQGGDFVLLRGSVATEVGTIYYLIDQNSLRAMSAPGRGADDWQRVLSIAGLDASEAGDDVTDALGVRRELSEYLDGDRQRFSLPLNFSGTPFQERVWEALRGIPYGEVRTYADIAREIGAPRAARAVGQANNRNPLAIVIPCHRVVASGAGLGGYAGGLDSKEYLLKLEQRYLA